MTTAELADLLGISSRVAYRMAREGRFGEPHALGRPILWWAPDACQALRRGRRVDPWWVDE